MDAPPCAVPYIVVLDCEGGVVAIYSAFRAVLYYVVSDDHCTTVACPNPIMRAVLHDVVEKSDQTLEDLRREGFSDEIIDAVDRLTKRQGEDYETHIERAKIDPLSLKVKIADLEDNMDPKRIIDFSEEDKKRLERFHKSWLRLKKTECYKWGISDRDIPTRFTMGLFVGFFLCLLIYLQAQKKPVEHPQTLRYSKIHLL